GRAKALDHCRRGRARLDSGGVRRAHGARVRALERGARGRGHSAAVGRRPAHQIKVARCYLASNGEPMTRGPAAFALAATCSSGLGLTDITPTNGRSCARITKNVAAVATAPRSL